MIHNLIRDLRASLWGFFNDTRGLASVEVTILLATLGIAAAGAGFVAGPVIKQYTDHLTAAVQTARCLAAGEAGAPFPNCP